MKTWMISILFGGLIFGLTGCGKSAQEKVAEEQLKAIEQENVMREALSKNLKDQAAKPLPEIRTVKPISWSSLTKEQKKSN